jgi:hypothetical protein
MVYIVEVNIKRIVFHDTILTSIKDDRRIIKYPQPAIAHPSPHKKAIATNQNQKQRSPLHLSPQSDRP